MTKKTRIEIAVLLPAVPDARDACVKRLGDLLRANEGIEAAHLPDTNGKEPSSSSSSDVSVSRFGASHGSFTQPGASAQTANLPNPISDTGRNTGEICIHYDPDRLSIGEVRDLARRAGVELEKRFGHLLLKTEPMYARRAQMVESRARRIAGVMEAAASPAGVLRIEFDRQVADEAGIRASSLPCRVIRNERCGIHLESA